MVCEIVKDFTHKLTVKDDQVSDLKIVTTEEVKTFLMLNNMYLVKDISSIEETSLIRPDSHPILYKVIDRALNLSDNAVKTRLIHLYVEDEYQSPLVFKCFKDCNNNYVITK